MTHVSAGAPLRALLLAALALTITTVAHAATIEYLGNEAVLVTDGETSILIDAFFDNDYGRYRMVPDKSAKLLMAAEERFASVDYVLVTHEHGDHFQADQIVEFITGGRLGEQVALPRFGQSLELGQRGVDGRLVALRLDRLETFDL